MGDCWENHNSAPNDHSKNRRLGAMSNTKLRLKKLTFKFKAIKLHSTKSYQIYNKNLDFSMFSFHEAKIEFLA